MPLPNARPERVTARVLAAVVVLFALAAPASPQSPQTAAQDMVLVLDPAQSKVHYSVDSTLHTVHGTFNLKGGNLHFDPDSGKASGEIVVYATSGESGNDARDDRMHKEILQTQQFPEATFRPTKVEGKVTRAGACDVQLHGVILLHGQEHEMTASVHAELTADHWTGTAKFDVPYIQWGIKDPSNWLLKVKPVVHVEVEMSGATNPTGTAK
jgi:polyisoprenoid-binding protein YceI